MAGAFFILHSKIDRLLNIYQVLLFIYVHLYRIDIRTLDDGWGWVYRLRMRR